ncbi:cation diffusion facilitator family transporter [Myxococcota bacterium]
MCSQLADREKQRVALSSLGAAVLLTVMKLAVGVTTGSLGILSEAAHSGLDLIAAMVTFLAVRASGRPADGDHTYGHGKIENLSALFETALLLVTCLWIVYEAVARLVFRPVEVDASVWAFVVMAVSIIVDVSRSRALAAAAKKHRSQALEADGLHFSTDVWSSGVVIVGLTGVAASRALGLPWLSQADAVAALGVAAIVIWVSVRLGKRSVDCLLDAVPEDLQERLVRAATVPGVKTVEQLRVRQSGPETFADVTVTMAPDVTLERAHELTRHVEEAVRLEQPNADVVVHIEPAALADEDAIARIHGIAARHGFPAHAVTVTEQCVSLHVEFPEHLRLAEAHELASALERDVRDALPYVKRVVTHLEPRGPASVTARPTVPPDEDTLRRVENALSAVCRHETGCRSPRGLIVSTHNGQLDVSFRCSMDAETPLDQTHQMAERVEQEMRAHLPDLSNVTIQVEPEEHE